MKVALDVSALDPDFRAHAARGTGRYVAELYRRLSERMDLDIHPFRYCSAGRGTAFDRLIDLLPAGRTTLKHQVGYPLSVTKELIGGSHLIHFPVHGDAPAWCRTPYVVTVLDLIPLVFKELYAPTKNDVRFRFARWLELQSIKNAVLVLVISEHTGRDVHELLGVPYERIVVTPLAVNDEIFGEVGIEGDFRAKIGIASQRPYVLYVGGIDQRKNIHFLVKTFHDVLRKQQEDGKVEPLLVMAGRIETDAEYPKFRRVVEELGLQEHVLETGYVSDEVLVQLYLQAEVFFYPSLYEGFGLPPLEAMSVGTPVVSSHTSSLPEVLGSAAITFDPTDQVAAVQGLLEVLRNEDLKGRLRDAGHQQARKFSWEKTAEETLAGYSRAMSLLSRNGVPQSEKPAAFSSWGEKR